MRAHTEFLLGSVSHIARRTDFGPRASKMNRADRRRFKNREGGNSMSRAMAMSAANQQAQDAILAIAQPMSQPLAPVTFTGNNVSQGQLSNIVLNNVGLNTKLVIEVTFTIAQAAAETLNRTPFGLANFFSNVTLTDLNNIQRVNTTGWHLHMLATLRNRGAFGAAYVNDNPVNIGSNYNVVNGPSAVTAAKTCRMFFEVPIAYSDADLRGAIYAGVTSAQWRLQLTVNPNLIVSSATTDATGAMYQSTTADVGLISAVTIQVYQEYLDQLPRSNGQVVLPALSLAYNYLLTNTSPTGMAAGLDFPVFYPNFRTFLSTIFMYNQAGTLAAGTDLNFIGLQIANMTYITKWDPYRTQLAIRNMIGDDFPAGVYALDHRRKPIDTNQYGNTALVINPITAAAGSSLQIGYEQLAIQNQALNAGSLQGG